ncbi:hypothetical protein MAPG_01102 [Magnaporthiopsis poae ATCC 64411]|uniref:DUF7102 domain-containing protein n=1 Tax=Magnaporthiopsis poae (strain ATCC 64411 / 73-15) TaxID=644358 RepID=A0A0C4DMT9_MAGP6|nr:hypothetical protein MAPG_01102 [Magnaporthiopsis poae ATCC 64411]
MDADPDLLGPESALAYGYHVENWKGGRGALLTNHRFNPLHPSFLDRIPADTFDEGPFGDECLAHSTGLSTRRLERETFGIDAEILRVVAEACRGPDEDEDALTPLVEELCRLRAPEPPPLWELPLVSASSEAEYRALVRRIQTAEPVSIEVDDIPLDAVDVDRGQGMAFPPSVHAQMAQMDRSLAQGIQVTKESLMYLAQQLKNDDCANRGFEDLLENLAPPRGKKPRDFHLTPPATPQFAQAEPFIPDSDSAQIPSPSEPRSLASEDLEIAETTIFDRHKDEIHHPGSPTAGLSVADPLMIDSSPSDGPPMEPCEKKLTDYKLEVPLFSSHLPEPPAIDIDFTSLRLAAVSETVDDNCDRIDRHHQDKLQEAAEKAARCVEQEQFDPLDGLVRIKVPLVDSSRPVAVWSPLIGDTRAMFKHIIQSRPWDFDLPKWQVDKRAERELRWAFAALSAAVSTTETLTAAEDLNLDELLGANDDIPESALFVQKAEGLAVLRRSQDSDDDVEPEFDTPSSVQSTVSLPDPAVSDPDDLMTLVRKRKKAAKKLKTQRPLKRTKGEADARPRETLLMDGQHPQSAELLKTFLRARGMASPEPNPNEEAVTPGSPNNAVGDQTTRNSGAIDDGIQPAASPETLVADKTDETSAEKAAEAPPMPPVDLPDFSLKLIISMDLPRGLVRGLQDLLPGVVLIERDYNAHDSMVWNAGAPGASTIMSPLSDEVDIAVSPATGIITASTVQVRQQPSDGCGGDNALQRRVRRTSLRYERLIVLVSDGSLDITAACPMSDADRLAFVKFQAFAAQLAPAATVSVYWVAGGEAAIASSSSGGRA